MSTVNIPITGDATSLVAATQKANAALNTIGVAADKANAKITPAMGNLTTGAQKAAAALGPLGGVLSKISPEAGAAAASIAGAASAAQGLSGALLAATGSATMLEVAMGPVGLAFAAVTALVAGAVLVYSELESQADKAAAAQLVLAASADAVAAAEGRIADAKYRLKLAMGLETAEQARAQAVKKENLNIQADELAAGQLVFALEKEVREANAQGAIKAGIDAQARLDDAKKSQKAVQDAGEAAAKLAGDEAEYAFEQREEGKRDAARNAEKAAGSKTQADADKQKNEAARALKTAVDAVATAQTALAGITHDSSVSNLDALGKEADAYQTKLDRIYEITAAALANAKAAGLSDTKILADSLAAQEAVEKEHAQNVAKIKAAAAEKEQKEYEDRIAKLDALNVQAAEKALSDAETAFTAQLSVAEGYYAAAGKLSGLLTEATSKDFDTSTQAGKDAAIKQFNTQKAVAVALSIAQGALAVVQAIGSAPPPFNIPAIVATGIAVTAETATIAAQQPKFHTGTTGFRPDEGGAVLQRGEGVVTAAGMAKPGMRETVAAANSGRTPGGNGGSMSVQYQHKVYNEFIRDNLKAGSPLTRRIDSGTKVGHRQTRS